MLPDDGTRPVLLMPPSPPGAPHVGSLYTWCLGDMARRITAHLARDGILPQSWNMSSRRLESSYGTNQASYTEYCESAIASTIGTASRFGIAMARDLAIRDDVPLIRRHVQLSIQDLAGRGAIRFLNVTEKWCLTCELALPPTSSVEHCFKCAAPLRTCATKDWFLSLDHDTIRAHAESIQWIPGYAFRRFRNLQQTHPLIRVAHPHRTLGVASPLHHGHIVDPRLAAALAPDVLRRLGIDGPIVAIAGFDIQRKWLLTMLAANTVDALPLAVINHGTLLDENGRKLSRYSGASLSDLPPNFEAPVIRAALLSVPLGKDVRLSDLPLVAASRLRNRVVNSLRFLRLRQPDHSRHSVDLDLELTPYLSKVEDHLANFDTVRALNAYREAIAHRLSKCLIPRIRWEGATPHELTSGRIRSLHQIFFGEDPGIDPPNALGVNEPESTSPQRS